MLLRADSRIFVLSFVILAGQAALLCERIAAGETRTADRPGLRAGAQAIDVSPRTFPVLINGGFLQSSATRVNDALFAKCLVLDDGTTRLAIVILDSCMMPRELLDRANEMARKDRDCHRPHADRGDSNTFGSGGHGGPGMPGRPGLCCTLARSNCRGNRASGCQSRSRAAWLGNDRR